ncbi:MAG TPA: IS1595 family transposase, partial [Mycobacterium sp.]
RRRSAARGMLFYRLLQQSVNTDPHPLHELIGGIDQPEPLDLPNEA